MTPVHIVAIAGGSCSGKTTLAQALHQRLGDKNSALIFQDSYYRDQSKNFRHDGDVNFDHPDAIEWSRLAKDLESLASGQTTQIPIYNFVSHTREAETLQLDPRPLLILDGTLLLHVENIRRLCAIRVFVEAEESVRFERRKLRDTLERGRSLEGIQKQFEVHVKPMHDTFVEPSKQYASMLVNGETFGSQQIEELAALVVPLQKSVS